MLLKHQSRLRNWSSVDGLRGQNWARRATIGGRSTYFFPILSFFFFFRLSRFSEFDHLCSVGILSSNGSPTPFMSPSNDGQFVAGRSMIERQRPTSTSWCLKIIARPTSKNHIIDLPFTKLSRNLEKSI